MGSPSSPPFGYILNDHNHGDHSPQENDSNRPNINLGRPPTYSYKSHSQSLSKPQKNTLKDSIYENNSSSSRVGNHHNNYSSYHNNQVVISRRQARVLDRWATQQARETISSIDRQKYDIPAISDSDYMSFASQMPSREPSPIPSDSSVSSLVQKWREFEATEINNFGGCSMLSSRTSSMASSIEPFDPENHSTNTLEDADPQAFITSICHNSIGDIINQGGTEKDRVRVIDIIKKLPLVECKDVRALSSTTVMCSPRIRGRQALADFLAKLENDRYSEIEATSKRRVVSNFTKRGFLQSMLKLRLLRLQVSTQDQALQELHGVCALNKQLLEISSSSCNSMNSLRERFNPVITECYDFVKTRQNQVDKLISNLLKKRALTSNHEPQAIKVISHEHQEKISLPQINNPISEVSRLEKNQVDNLDTKKSLLESEIHHQEQQEGNRENMDSIPSSNEIEMFDKTLQEVTKEEHGQPKLIHSSNAKWPEMIDSNEVTRFSLDTNNMSSYEEHMGYEEEKKEEIYENYDFCGINLDWINDVSRPRSYWESLRQAWYKEIYTTSSKNEIRQLIERGSVANVLASDFRDKMDKIMMSSTIKRKIQSITYNDKGENHSSVGFHHTELQPLSIHLEKEEEGNQNQHQHQSNNEEQISNIDERREESKPEFAQEKNLKKSEEKDDKFESLSSHQFKSRDYYYEQFQDPLSHFSRRKYKNQEDNDNSNQIEGTPQQQQQSSITNFYDQETREGSSIKNNPSIEMELLYDLRAHMKQMCREIYELRKSLNHCVDMQAKLQRTIKDEVFVALNHSCSNKTKGKESNGKAAKKGFCTYCYEKKVDSVLYRCGHMCACFKCAHELQWRREKCPICLAEIVDVVRVFTHA